MPSSNSVSGLIKWLARDPWRDAFLDILNEHVEPILEEHYLSDFDDLGSLIDPHWAMTIWGCAFEDFLTKYIGDEGYMADDYLKRRGWKETARDKAYIAGLKTSVMSIYEVSEIKPGKSFLARDLIRGGNPVKITEHTASKTLKHWDRLAMRIVEVRKAKFIGGGLLPYDRDLSERLLDKIGKSSDRASDDLQCIAPIFSQYFLDAMVNRESDPIISNMVNSEGDEIEIIRVVYQLSEIAKVGDVRNALGKSPELETSSQTFWNWISKRAPSLGNGDGKALGGLSFITTTDTGGHVLGTVELKPKTIELFVNSESRANRGQKLLTDLLGDLVSFPLMERQALEQALNDQHQEQFGREQSDIDPDDHREIVHDAMDRHYRAQLDQKIPALGNISPRTASKSAKGRRKLES